MNKQLPSWLSVRNSACDNAAEIRISGQIGKDWWTGSGMSESDFADALSEIPSGRPIRLLINSEGGSVQDGLAIYNAIKARSEDVTAHITGYAVSIASVIPLAASKVISPKSSMWMIHKPWSIQTGNADEMRKAAEMLDKHEDVLVGIYMEATGKTADEIKAALTEETWMTGEEAVAFGLADECNDEPVALNKLQGSRYRRMPLALGDVPPPQSVTQTTPKGSDMDTATNTATAPAAGATSAANMDTLEGAQLMKKLHDANERIAQLQLKSITNTVDGLIANGQIGIDQRQMVIDTALKNESILEILAKNPKAHTPPPPIPGKPLITGGDDAISKMQKLATPKARWDFAVSNWGDIRSAERNRGAVQAANTHSGLSTITASTVADGVTTVLQNRCAALRGLSRDFSANPMIPRQPIIVKQVSAGGTAQSNATNFEDSTNFVGTIEPKTITPAQLTAGGHITIAELNSGLRMNDWVEIKSAELADKIMAAVAAIITTSNFTATPLVSAASAFGGSDLKTLWGQLKKARVKSLILDGEYYARLLPANQYDYNVDSGNTWPGWNGVFLNTVWTGATSNTVGFACDPNNAIAVAAGLPLNPPSASDCMMVNTFTVPGVELSVAQHSWFSLSSRTDWMTLDVVFGAALNDGTAGVLIKSS